MTCRPSLGSGTTLSGTVSANVTGSVDARPAGLTIGGKISLVTINAASWTPLPATAYANRNALSIQNISGTEIKINYDNTTAGYVGVTIATGSERFYSISDSIIIYAKAAAGTPTIQTEEIA